MTAPPTPRPRRPLHPSTQTLVRRVLGGGGTPDHPLREVVVVDTETTGAGPGARLVELAAVHARDGVVLREFQTLIHPGMRIPWNVIQVHGITDAMVRNAPPARDALPAFLAFLGALPMVAHNASFDRGILAGELTRAGIPSPGIPVYCTLRLARRAFPEAPNHKLGTLAQFLSLGTQPAHRALADCRAALGVLTACVGRLHGPALTAGHGPARIL